MEVASGVAGLLSLGITTCNGLVNYYRSWSSQDETIASLLQGLTSLRETLELFQKPLEDLWLIAERGQLSLAQTRGGTIIDHINTLRDCLKVNVGKLERVLERCNTHANASSIDVRSRVQRVKKKAGYPLKTQTIQDLRQTIHDLQVHLSLCNNALQLNVDLRLLEQQSNALNALARIDAQSTQHESLALSIQTTTQSTEAKVDKLHSQLQNAEDDIQSAGAEVFAMAEQGRVISASLSGLNRQTVLQSNAQSEGFAALATQMQNGFARMQKALEAGSVSSNSERPLPELLARAMMSKPSLHRELCDASFNSSSQCLRCTNHFPLRFRRRTRLGITEFIQEYEDKRVHSHDCPLYTPKTTSISYRARLNPLKWFLNRTVEAAFTWSQGPGGSLISAGLNIRVFVNPDSPALKYLEILQEQAEDTGRTKCPKKVLRELKQYYCDGQASPLDVDERGTNALLRCFTIIRYLSVEDASKWMRLVFCGLVEAGALLSEFDQFGRSPLAFYFQHSDRDPVIIKEAISLGADSLWIDKAYNYKDGIGWSPGSELFRAFPNWFDALPAGKLCSAVLARSEEKVATTLLYYPDAIEERISHGFHALHLAADWPQGIRLLLSGNGSSLIHAKDRWGASALDHALLARNVEAMRLLIDAGCLLVDEHRVSFGKGRLLDEVLVRALKTRRQALLAFAKTHLSPSSSMTPIDCVLDEGIESVVSSLLQKGIKIPEWLSTKEWAVASRYKSIYFNETITSEAAGLLWSEGFRDINTIDGQGRSPLLQHYWYASFDVVDWLVSKGGILPASCTRSCPFQLPSFMTVTPHHVVSNMSSFDSQSLNYPKWRIDEVAKLMKSSRDWRTFESAIKDNARDSCSCACSNEGCTPLLVALKQIASRRLVDFWVFQTRHYVLDISQRAPLEVIRFITFEVFELTHTCCRHRWRCLWSHPPPEEEIVEIQDEERLLIFKLEAVVVQLERTYQHAELSLSDFLHQHWKEAVSNALSISETSSDEALSELKSIGVEVRDTRNEDLDEESNEEEVWYDHPRSRMLSKRVDFWVKFFDPSFSPMDEITIR